MDGEAQGKASHSCKPSKPAACLGLMGSVEWIPFSLRDGEHCTEGSTSDPLLPQLRPGPGSFSASWNLPSPDAVSST